jgi:N-methylhydantoinase A/oxoprolinase/acetone carboxylase beta subunit
LSLGAEVNKLTHDRTTTDICALLKTGFPRQSAAFVKVAGVRTNFTIPDVHSIPLGGGSLVRTEHDRTCIGPDSVGSRLARDGIYFGGQTLTVSNQDSLASSMLKLLLRQQT